MLEVNRTAQGPPCPMWSMGTWNNILILAYAQNLIPRVDGPHVGELWDNKRKDRIPLRCSVVTLILVWRGSRGKGASFTAHEGTWTRCISSAG
jgi:hypothetical protein